MKMVCVLRCLKTGLLDIAWQAFKSEMNVEVTIPEATSNEEADVTAVTDIFYSFLCAEYKESNEVEIQ